MHPCARGWTHSAPCGCVSPAGASLRARVDLASDRDGATTAGASPRARGNPLVPQEESCRLGASPRARGNRCATGPATTPLACIPARAGEPSRMLTKARCASVHPRARGGTTSDPAGGRHSSGASPRARGNPRPLLFPAGRARCIPARAGEPRY